MINDENKTNWSDQKELKDGRKYSYYLTARGANGETEPSTEIKAKTKDLPPVPKSFNAKSGFVKSVELSWTPFDDPDVGGYSIYRGPDETNLVKIATVKGCKSDSFMDKGKLFSPLEDGMKYYYLIAAFNLFDAEGKASKPIAANTKPRPGKSKGLTATAKKDCIFIKWNKNPEPDIKAYILYRSKNKGRWSKLLELNSSQTSYTDKNLKPELNYCYQIIAEDKDGLKSDPSESNSISSPLIKIKG
jgi:fibronectin type 3 domain-containing protein